MFGRIANLFKGFFSLFISGVERRNPEALLELEQENLRKQVGNFNQGLASHAGLSERLMSQVRKLEAEQKDLRAKTTAHVRAGNNAAAGQYALRLQSVEAQLEENRKQLEQAEVTYKNLVKARDVAVQTARAKIESLKGAINDMRMNQAMAELHEMSAGMITDIGGAGDTLNRLEGMVKRRTRQGRRPRACRQGRGRHDGRQPQGSRAHRPRRPGTGGFRRARRHLDQGCGNAGPGRTIHGCHRKTRGPGLMTPVPL
jgi:phage shock protein A